MVLQFSLPFKDMRICHGNHFEFRAFVLHIKKYHVKEETNN